MTTLEKIRAEIENHCGLIKENHCRYCSYCNSVIGIREILDIINKCAEQEPSEDAVSRADMWKVVHQCEENNSPSWVWREMLSQLPSVQPKPKTGHWDKSCRCSECKEWSILESEKLSGKYKFCPNCGCRMVKPRESEDKG